MSQQYVAAIALLIVSILKYFGIEIGTEVITNIIMGVIAIWIAVRRHQVGDITLFGLKK